MILSINNITTTTDTNTNTNTMEIVEYIPQLPKNIIERILNEANLPRSVRLYFIDYGYNLEPRSLKMRTRTLQVEEDLYYIHRQRFAEPFPEFTDRYVYTSFIDYDFEFSIYEFEGTIYYKFDRVTIDYETGDIITLRSTLCNYLTGEMITNITN